MGPPEEYGISQKKKPPDSQPHDDNRLPLESDKGRCRGLEKGGKPGTCSRRAC